MRKLVLIFLFVFSGLTVAQSADQKKILADTQSFMDLLRKKDYNGILNMTHPAILEKFDKEALIAGFKSAFEGGSEAYKIEVKNIAKSAFQVSDVFKTPDNSSEYAFATYPITLIVTFMNEKLDEPRQQAAKAIMEGKGMKVQFLNDNTMEMSKPSMIIALKDKSTGNAWKYLNYDESNMMLLFVVPNETMKKAKEYYAGLLNKQQENAN